jgi:hypothetical protein
VQIRRVLLLFALVLGLSALVASIAPPPEDSDEEGTPTAEEPAPVRPGAMPKRLSVSARDRRATHRVTLGSSFSLEVVVPGPGDVVLDGLGLRQSADELAPARFGLLAKPRGFHRVIFVPVDGERRVVGRLAFVDPATVTRPRRDR